MTKKSTTKKSKGGRPSKFKNIDLEKVRILAEYGLTDEQIAKILGIVESTLNEWKKKYPEFSESLNKISKNIEDGVNL